MEEWKISTVDNRLAVSTSGQVKNVKTGKVYKGRTTKSGYHQIHIRENGDSKFYYVHRIIALTFIPNPYNLPQVNHRDENKLNNCVDNLEWCDAKYNSNYGTHIQRMMQNRTGSNRCKPVLQFDKNGSYINRFNSVNQASRSTGIGLASISQACNNIQEFAGGYKWMFEKDYKGDINECFI